MKFFSKQPDPVKDPPQVAAALQRQLRDNLQSLVIYGSAVRGGFNPKKSDINLMLILKDANMSALLAISKVLSGFAKVNPMIIDAGSLPRDLQVFRLKFSSIQRHYQVLAGCDPFSGGTASLPDRFQIEQALRNLQLRLARQIVLQADQTEKLNQLLVNQASGLMTEVSYIPRLAGCDIANSFLDRLPQLEKYFGLSLPNLALLLKIQSESGQLNSSQCFMVFEEVKNLLKRALEMIATETMAGH